jgi:hypothetical protein
MRYLVAITLASAASLCWADQVLVVGDVVSSHAPVHKSKSGEPTSIFGSMGACSVVPTHGVAVKPDTSAAWYSLYPEATAGQLFPDARFNAELQADIEAADIQLVKEPLHGSVVFSKELGLQYLPKKNFVGSDEAVFLVSINTHQVRVVRRVEVVPASFRNFDGHKKALIKHCPRTQWKISAK